VESTDAGPAVTDRDGEKIETAGMGSGHAQRYEG
jgi:hypothetical protein